MQGKENQQKRVFNKDLQGYNAEGFAAPGNTSTFSFI